MTIRIVIADDHSVVRQGLRLFLGSDPEFEIVGEARDGVEAVQLARALRPDVILLDLIMPRLDGLGAATAIRRELPEVEVVALTSVLEEVPITRAIQAGAIGYLLKDTEAHELRRAIRAAAFGQVQLSPQVAALLAPTAPDPPEAPDLTTREMEVLRLLAAGQSNREIALRLQIGEQTVKTHVAHILSKLDFVSRTQAAVYALRMGWAARLDAP